MLMLIHIESSDFQAGEEGEWNSRLMRSKGKSTRDPREVLLEDWHYLVTLVTICVVGQPLHCHSLCQWMPSLKSAQ